MSGSRLVLSREQILAHRRRVGALDMRLPRGRRSLRLAAWAGLQDSVPRAALLSIHARVAGVTPDTWEDASLVQLWGPRFSAYVVARRDTGVFTLGRLADGGARRRRAEELASRLRELLDGRRMTYGEAGRALGVHPNALRNAAPTGTVLMRWDGARQPTVWCVPPPELEAQDARLELARRHLHVFGPATPEAFAAWAGVRPKAAHDVYVELQGSLTPVRTPIGESLILARDERAIREPPGHAAPARLLPSGDAYYLLQGLERELLVPDAGRRSKLWTSRVWPGAVLAGGEIVGTWRRAGHRVTIEPWGRLASATREAVEEEAVGLPLPGEGSITVQWAD